MTWNIRPRNAYKPPTSREPMQAHSHSYRTYRVPALLFGIILLLCFLRLSPRVTGAAAGPDEKESIGAHYTIRLLPDRHTLHVTAVFENLFSPRLYLGFLDRFLPAGEDNLTRRIRDIEITPETFPVSEPQKGSHLRYYGVRTSFKPRLTVSYTFDTSAAPYDIHLTYYSSGLLQIVGEDLLIRVTEDENKIKNFRHHQGLGFFDGYTITLENMPPEWQLVANYPMPSAHSLRIENMDGGNVLFCAGQYRKVDIPAADGNARVSIALHKKISLNLDKYARRTGQIFRYYYRLYNCFPAPRTLMIINRHPVAAVERRISLKGHAKEHTVLISLALNQKSYKGDIPGMVLGLIAHEAHHFWLPQGFIVTESWKWFWEGFTEYISKKGFLKPGLNQDKHLQKALNESYQKYKDISIKEKVNLLQASSTLIYGREGRILLYDKGMLVAFLLEKRLPAQNKTLEKFMGDFYRTFAVAQKPVGNREIITFIDQYLGDSSFTKDYVLGTTPITKGQIRMKGNKQ